MRPIWSGSVGFGLVNIPVKILSGVRPTEEQLHERHAPDGSPIERHLFCSAEGVEIDRSDISRAYEYDGTMIPISDSEIESVAPYHSRTIDIEKFVPADDFDRGLIDRPYFLDPGDEGEGALRSYRLLARVLEEEEKAAIARFVMRSGERLAAITSTGGRLRLHTLHFPAEVRPADVVNRGAAEVGVKELKEARRLIEQMRTEWEPESFDDHRAQRVRRLAREKQARGELAHPKTEAEPKPGGDLMGALQKSLDETYARGEAKPRKRRRKGRGLVRTAGLSKEELYEQAKQMDIPGRSKMTKEELEEAITR